VEAASACVGVLEPDLPALGAAGLLETMQP